MAKILIADDDAETRSVLARLLERAGHDVLHATTGVEAVQRVHAERPAIVLLDLFLPDITGFEVLERTREHRPVVVMITAAGDVPAAVHAMQNGAEAFLTRPVELAHAGAVVDRALEKAHLRELGRAADDRRGRKAAALLPGNSAEMRDLAEQIGTLARSERTVVLLVGEHGVGKSRVARAIHALSPRAPRPFQEADCTLRPAELLERELFGADGSMPVPGLFETADGGTLFLDEIAHLPGELQPALLRAMEAHRVHRAGGAREIPVDVRIIAATVQDLATEVTEQRFREDLYYRLGVMPLHLPPLRARAPDDIREMVQVLMQELRPGLPDAPESVSEEAMAALTRHSWPGNVRELRNVVERALIQGRGEERIRLAHLAAEVRGATGDADAPHVSQTLAQVERGHIERTLRAHAANRTRAARELGISRATLIKKIREFGLGERTPASSTTRQEES